MRALLQWSEHALGHAIDAGFWGWTAHRFIPPQYGPLWDDVAWHRRLTDTFLTS